MAAVSDISRACAAALPALAQVAHQHRVGAAELALACGRAIAGAALEHMPGAPIQAAIEILARELESAPRLVVAVAPEMAERLQPIIEEAGRRAGFPGAVQVRGDPAQRGAAFTLDFGDGAASFSPEAAAERVTQALQSALLAEGLHAEPLIPGG
jgi:flagellar assembly protein FliH